MISFFFEFQNIDGSYVMFLQQNFTEQSMKIDSAICSTTLIRRTFGYLGKWKICYSYSLLIFAPNIMNHIVNLCYNVEITSSSCHIVSITIMIVLVTSITPIWLLKTTNNNNKKEVMPPKVDKQIISFANWLPWLIFFFHSFNNN